MKRAIFALLAVLLSPDVRAIPQNFTNGGLPGLGGGFFGPVVPARPKFNADLTHAVLDMANWDAIITGYNAERGEFIFMEPWGEHTRGRRMRQEEMAAASYAVFQFKLQ